MKYCKTKLVILLTLLLMVPWPLKINAQSFDNPDLKWWNEARFGLFIHWGIYSVPAGVWEGERVEGIGEQIMRYAQISNKDYMKLSKEFNPIKFDADEWVTMAKNAGMKYIVITAKHHDGFAMYDSKVSEYDIVDATPYGKDVMKELAKACQEQGVKLCFYYSHRQDWNEPNGAHMEWPGQYDAPESERTFNFQEYMHRKAIPQVKELLTQYGPIGLIWYDTAIGLTVEQSNEFKNLVKQIQPHCLVNGRVGNNVGDYRLLGDNEVPWRAVEAPSESVGTMNRTWGYKRWDHEWKRPIDLIQTLVSCASKGANYLLNVGPKSSGEFPLASKMIMEDFGAWMKKNSESVYGTSPSIFNREFPWGTSTTKGDKIYLHLFNAPKDLLVFRGLKNKVESAKILSNGNKLNVDQKKFGSAFETSISLPAQLPNEAFSVIELTLNGKPEAIGECYQFNNGSLTLPACMALVLKGNTEKIISFNNGGATQNFNNGTGSLLWNYTVSEPGKFLLKLYTNRHWRSTYPEGAVVSVTIDGKQQRTITLHENIALKNVRLHSYPESVSYLGEVEMDESGKHTIELSVENVGYVIKNWFYDEVIPVTPKSLQVLQLELDKIDSK